MQIDVQDDKEKKTAIIVGNAGPISLENIELDLGFPNDSSIFKFHYNQFFFSQVMQEQQCDH